MADVKLSATKRAFKTKGELNQSRKNGFVPGVYYSQDDEPISILVEEREIHPVVFTSETNTVYLSVDKGEELRCIIKDVQFDPVSDRVIHFDLLGLTAGHELQMTVPVNLIGNSVGVIQGGSIQLVMHKLEIACLPKNIPDDIEIDVTDLDIGQSIYIRDLDFSNVRFLTSEDAMVVTCASPKGDEAEESEAEDGTEIVEPEVINQSKSEDEG